MGGQSLVDIALAILSIFAAAGGFIMKSIQSELKDLRQRQDDHLAKINEIEVLVARENVTKQEFSKAMGTIFDKLDKLYEKLDGKADR